MNVNVSQAERDDVLGVAVALLRCTLTDDNAGAELLMSAVSDPLPVLGTVLGFAREFGVAAFGGEHRFGDVLEAWQPGQQLGEGFGDVGDDFSDWD